MAVHLPNLIRELTPEQRNLLDLALDEVRRAEATRMAEHLYQLRNTTTASYLTDEQWEGIGIAASILSPEAAEKYRTQERSS